MTHLKETQELFSLLAEEHALLVRDGVELPDLLEARDQMEEDLGATDDFVYGDEEELDEPAAKRQKAAEEEMAELRAKEFEHGREELARMRWMIERKREMVASEREPLEQLEHDVAAFLAPRFSVDELDELRRLPVGELAEEFLKLTGLRNPHGEDGVKVITILVKIE